MINLNYNLICLLSQICLISGAFKLYDVDSDGFITKDEMFKIVESIYLMLGNQSQKDDNEASTRVDMIFNQLDKVIFIIHIKEKLIITF